MGTLQYPGPPYNIQTSEKNKGKNKYQKTYIGQPAKREYAIDNASHLIAASTVLQAKHVGTLIGIQSTFGGGEKERLKLKKIE